MTDTADNGAARVAAGKMTNLIRPGEAASVVLPSSQLAQVLWFDGSGSEFFFQNTNLTIQRVVFLNHTLGPSDPLNTPSVVEGTGLAAVDWYEGDELRLYYQQAVTGAIIEQAFEEGEWSYHALPSNLSAALPGTALAAVTWGNGSDIRVYSQDDSLAIQEYAYFDNAWSSRQLDGTDALKGSGIAAIGWSNGQQLRVYFQSPTGALCEIVYNSNAGGWQLPTSLLPLDETTALAAVTWGGVSTGFAYVRVYYQASNGYVQDYCYNGTWVAGTLQVTNAQPQTPLCAVQWNNGSVIRVTYLMEGGGFGEAVWENGAWSYHSQTG